MYFQQMWTTKYSQKLTNICVCEISTDETSQKQNSNWIKVDKKTELALPNWPRKK